MYVAPSSGHISFKCNMPFKLILRRFEVVFWCLEWECCTFWKIDQWKFIQIHQYYTMAFICVQQCKSLCPYHQLISMSGILNFPLMSSKQIFFFKFLITFLKQNLGFNYFHSQCSKHSSIFLFKLSNTVLVCLLSCWGAFLSFLSYFIWFTPI